MSKKNVADTPGVWNKPEKWIFPADYNHPMPVENPFSFSQDGIKIHIYAYP
jgi:hypothetical protein